MSDRQCAGILVGTASPNRAGVMAGGQSYHATAALPVIKCRKYVQALQSGSLAALKNA